VDSFSALNKMAQDSQYDVFCDNGCGVQLTEDQAIFCLSRGDDEETWCADCTYEHWKRLKAEGWACDDDADWTDFVEAIVAALDSFICAVCNGIAQNDARAGTCIECGDDICTRTGCSSTNNDGDFICANCCPQTPPLIEDFMSL
jgi:hypothetical protein